MQRTEIPPSITSTAPVNSFTESAATVRRPASAHTPGAGLFALYNRRVQTTL